MEDSISIFTAKLAEMKTEAMNPPVIEPIAADIDDITLFIA